MIKFLRRTRLYLNGLYCRLFGKVTYRVRFVNSMDPNIQITYRYINTTTGQSSEPTPFCYDIKPREIKAEHASS